MPGFISQITRFLTTKQYQYYTVYMDQVSILSYVYLQKTASEEETLEGKDALERYAPDIGVTIKTYHADNIFFSSQEVGQSLPQRRPRPYLCRGECTPPEMNCIKLHQGAARSNSHDTETCQQEMAKIWNRTFVALYLFHGKYCDEQDSKLLEPW